MAALRELTDSDFESADTAERKLAATRAVSAATDSTEKKAVAGAAMDALSEKERADLLKSWIPEKSSDRMVVFMTALIVAAFLAIGLALVAWKAADTDNENIATAIATAALSLPSAIIGGLFGAYVQR